MLHLQATNLSFAFHEHHHLFRNLNFDISAGELLHVRGSNGSGKTTLLKVLTSLLESSSGQLAVKVACEYLAAEHNGLYLKMDAVSNLAFWQNLRSPAAVPPIIQELDFWGLSHPLIRQHFPVEKFSTGMKRRLALARVRLSGTKLWLLDEPISGLDEAGIEKFCEVVQTHLNAGGSVILTSHDTHFLKKINHKTLDMNQ